MWERSRADAFRPTMPIFFFVLAFAITWGLQLPTLLASYEVIAGPPEKYMALVGLGAFGPMFAAMIAARVEGTGIRALFRRLGIWRVGGHWYLVAILAPGGLFVVAAGLYNLLGHHEPLLYPPNAPAFVAAAIVFPFGEEVGWRGFALPRLIERVGPIAASAIIGVLWTAWHIPMLALQGVSPMMYLVFVPLMLGGSVFFTWLFQHTRGSLLLAVLAHVGTHLNNPGHSMPGRSAPMVIHMVAYVVLAVVLIAVDRSVWRRPAIEPAK
jgi:membrane protease YdiL (CAAX protease family)